MKLTFEAMQTLMDELQQNEMWAIYLMGLGKEMTDKVTKTDLTNIIRVLCKNLEWIEGDPDDPVNDHENTNQSDNISNDHQVENIFTQSVIFLIICHSSFLQNIIVQFKNNCKKHS